MNDITHTYETVEGATVEVTYRKTILGDVRYRIWTGHFDETALDYSYRVDFAWIMAYVVSIKGATTNILTEHSAADDIEAAYFYWASLFDNDVWRQMLQDVTALRLPTTNAVEKPDDALTEEEAADPN